MSTMTGSTTSAARLTNLERILLLIPTAGGAIFGLFPLLAPVAFATAAGGTGDDAYIYRVAGAATLGYAVALVYALLDGGWDRARLVVIATLTFNAASLFACAVTLVSKPSQAVVWLIFVTSLIIVTITARMLYSHRGDPRPTPDTGAWLFGFLAVATPVAALFGLIPLFAPTEFGHWFGFKATDVFTFRQAAAAVLGYGALGVFELRSRAWAEIRSAAVMAGTFNALAAIVSIIALANGERSPLALIVAIAAGVVALVTIVEFVRRGR